MDKVMDCPMTACDGTIGLLRTIIKKSIVTGQQTESCVVGCDSCNSKNVWVELSVHDMDSLSLHRLARPEECGYEHG